MIVPDPLLEPALGALRVLRENTRLNFDLALRVGAVPAAGLYDAGFDLQGMECRWDRVEPAVPANEVISLVVTAAGPRPQGPVFKRVVELLDAIYGPPERRNPVSLDRLRLTGRKVALETRTRNGRLDVPYFLKNWLLTQYGRLFYLRSREGRYYTRRLVELVDTLVVDGKINTVVTGTPDQRKRLEDGLDAMEAGGEIAYGLFVSRQSIMSCYVTDRRDQHTHFVDGSDGGYTLAAAMWKRKLRR